LFISPIKIRVLDRVLFWIFHSSFEEQTIETSNEIKFAIMNLFIHPWQERLSRFDCNNNNNDDKSNYNYNNIIIIMDIHLYSPNVVKYSKALYI